MSYSKVSIGEVGEIGNADSLGNKFFITKFRGLVGMQVSNKEEDDFAILLLSKVQYEVSDKLSVTLSPEKQILLLYKAIDADYNNKVMHKRYNKKTLKPLNFG